MVNHGEAKSKRILRNTHSLPLSYISSSFSLSLLFTLSTKYLPKQAIPQLPKLEIPINSPHITITLQIPKTPDQQPKMLPLYVLIFLPTILYLVFTALHTTINYALQARTARSPTPSSTLVASPPSTGSSYPWLSLPWYTAWLSRLPFANRRTALIASLRSQLGAAERKARDVELRYGFLRADTAALQRINTFLTDEALETMRLQTHLDNLTAQNSGLKVQNAALQADQIAQQTRIEELIRKADASEASAYTLQMQVQYKCTELVGMTRGWQACRAEVRALEEELERERESWRGNTVSLTCFGFCFWFYFILSSFSFSCSVLFEYRFAVQS